MHDDVIYFLSVDNWFLNDIRSPLRILLITFMICSSGVGIGMMTGILFLMMQSAIDRICWIMFCTSQCVVLDKKFNLLNVVDDIK